jgi:hypothetical protein
MLIRALVVIAGVVCADEAPIMVAGAEEPEAYLLVACTNLLTCYFLGDRTLASFGGFVFPDLSGSVTVHDRYQNYDVFAGVAHQRPSFRDGWDGRRHEPRRPGALTCRPGAGHHRAGQRRRPAGNREHP